MSGRVTSALELQEEKPRQATFYIFKKFPLKIISCWGSLPYSSRGAHHCFEHLKKHQYLIKDRFFSLNKTMRKLKSKETTCGFSPRLPDPHLESTVEVVRPHLLLHLISLTSFLLLFSFLNLAGRLSQPAIMPIISWAWITEKVLLHPHENDIKVGRRKTWSKPET